MFIANLKREVGTNRKVIQITPQLETDISLRRLQDSVTAFTELVERAKAMLQSKGVEAPDEE